MKLYVLEASIRAFLTEISEQEGEMTPEQEEKLSSICGDLSKVLETLAVMSVECRAKYNQYDAMYREAKRQADEIKALADRYDRKSVKAHDKILEYMKALSMDESVTDLFRLVRTQSGGKIVLGEDFNIDEIPQEFVREKKELDRTALLELMRKEGSDALPKGIKAEATPYVRITKK